MPSSSSTRGKATPPPTADGLQATGGATPCETTPNASRKVSFNTATAKAKATKGKTTFAPSAPEMVDFSIPGEGDDRRHVRCSYEESMSESCTSASVPMPPGRSEHKHASVHGAAIHDHDADDDLSHDAGSVSSSGTDKSTTSSAKERNVGTTSLRACGAKIRVPFTVWTFAAMVVPIALVVMSGALQLSASVTELEILADHESLALVVGKCSGTLMQERGTLGPWLERGHGADLARLASVREGVDEHCGAALSELLLSLAHGSTAAPAQRWMRESARHSLMLQQLSVWRHEVDARRADGRQAREFLTVSITATSEMLVIVADALKGSGRAYSALFVLMGTRNYVGLARGVGSAIATFSPGDPAVDALGPEYLGAYAQSRTSYVVMQALAEPVLRSRLEAWAASESARGMWSLLDAMADPANGTARVQRNNASSWWPTVSAGLNTLHEVEEAHLADVLSGDARSDVRDAALFMSFGVLACLLAAGLLARLQSRVRRQLDEQMTRARLTKAAVSAFVPRFFLQKMGYTSITQVRAGEATSVALAMLFSDIRRFTTVSEGMKSSELFDWVQGYFKLMTTIVEGRRGNVNQFVGDAMFAVFSAPYDALQCAVDMQGSVDQLNLDRLREDAATVPIEVGVGIHHDVVALGILGDDKRHTCTAISSSVNLASRLEGLTKQLGCKIIASDAAVDQLTSGEREVLRMRRLGPVVVKGSAAAVTVHDVFHADVRELQLYKSATRTAFEELATACLSHEPTPATQAVLRRRLRDTIHSSPTPRGIVSDEAAGARLAGALPLDDCGCDSLIGPLPDAAIAPPPLPDRPMRRSATAHPLDGVSNANEFHRPEPTPEEEEEGEVVDGTMTNSATIPSHLVAAARDADSQGPSAALESPRSTTGSRHAKVLELMDVIVAALREYEVRDPAIEAVAVMANGSGTMNFLNK